MALINVANAIKAFNANPLGVTPLTISDTAANIATSLDTLNTMAVAGKITSVAFSTSLKLLPITAAQFSADNAIIALLPSTYTLTVSGVLAANVSSVIGNTHVTSITVSDSATNINSSLPSLITSLAKITSFTETGTIAPVNLTASQYSSALTAKFSNFTATVTGTLAANAASVAADKKVASISVLDTSANIAKGLDALQANIAKITSITQSSTATPLAITATQLTSDAAALAKITGTYTLSVTNVLAANVTTTIGNTHVTSMTVVDSATNITTSLSSIISNLVMITSITESGTVAPISLTAAQYSSTLTAKFSNFTAKVSGVAAVDAASVASDAKVASILVVDTSANIAASLDGIEANITKVTSITQSGNITALTINATQLINDAKALAKIVGSYTLVVTNVFAANVSSTIANTHVTSITVSDSATNITTNLSNLISNLAKISAITETGTITPISLTAAQYNSSLTAKFSNFTASISGVLAANVTSITADIKVGAVTVTDSATNITANLSNLISNLAKITTITETGTITPISMTAAQYSNALTSKFINFTATVSGVLSANATNVLTDAKVVSITVKDTAANLATNLDALQIAGAKLTAITQSDTGPLTISSAQLTADAATLAKINAGVYTLNVTNVTAATTATIAANTHVVSLAVTDTAANIALATNLTAFINAGSKLTTITQTGAIANIALTAAQYSAALTAKFANFTATLSAVTATFAGIASADAKVSAITVSDTAAGIAANLDTLHTNVTKITAITQTDANPLTISASQITNNADVLAKLGTYTLVVTNCLATDAASLVGNSHVTSISISDTAPNIAAQLDALHANITKITAITQTDANPLTITAAQLTSNADVLAKLGTYNLVVTKVLAADVAGLLANSHIKSISISDTAANIAAKLDALHTNVTKITTIEQSDDNALEISESQLISDADVLAKLVNTTGKVIEAGGINNAITGTPAVTGHLNVSNSNNSSNTFAAISTPVAASYGSYTIDASGHWTYTLDNSNSTVQALNVGQSTTDTFTVTSIDGTQKKITISINGTNDAAVISGTSMGEVVEAGGLFNAIPNTPTVTGTLLVSDWDSAKTFNAISTPAPTNYGTYTIDADGHWSYTLKNNNPYLEILNVGDKLTDTFKVYTADGTSQEVTITINGANDAAFIEGVATGEVVEAGGLFNAIPNTPTVTGTLLVSDWDSAKTFNAISTPAPTNYGTYTIDADGHWSYTLKNNNPYLEILNVGDKLTDTFKVYTADGTSQEVTITINGANDNPVITSTVQSGTVKEDEVLTVTGQVTSADVDQNATATYSVNHNVGSYGSLALDSKTGQWTYTFDNAHHQDLAHDESHTEIFTVTVTDDQGATAKQDVVITVNGTNDAPVITSGTQKGVVGGGGTNNTGGQVNATPIDHGSTVTYSADHTHGTYGSVEIDNRTGQWIYTRSDNDENHALAEGESRDETYVVTVNDGKGGITSQTITVTIVGTNDAPIVTSRVQVAEVKEDSVFTASGQVTSYDVDHGATATYSVNHNVGTYGSLEIDSQSGKWTYTLDNANHQDLAESESHDETFTVTVTDDKGATVQQDVIITIKGTNDAPVITSTTQTGEVKEDTTLTATGQVSSTDLDHGATATYSGAATGTYGSFVIDAATGVWTYTLDNANHHDLAQDETHTETFNVTVTDDRGAIAKQDVTITVKGTNNAVVIDGTSTGTVTEAGGVNNLIAGIPTATGTLTYSDINHSTNAFTAIPNPTASNYGTYTMDASGHWTYTLDNTNSTVQALNVGQSTTDTFSVSSIDGTQKDITITINGTNDAAVISGTSTGEVVEAGGGANAITGIPTVTGTLTATDIDNATNTFQVVSAATVSDFAYGSYNVDASGNWSYTVDNNNSEVQALINGQSLNDTFSVLSADGTIKKVTITINGSNDNLVVNGVLAIDAVRVASNPQVVSMLIADSSSNVATYLDSLESVNSKITSITLSDQTPITVSVAQLTTDHDVLAKITNLSSITVSDTAEHLSAAIDQLEAMGSQLGSVVITDHKPLTITSHQLTADATVLSKIAGGGLTALDITNPSTQIFDADNNHIYQLIQTQDLDPNNLNNGYVSWTQARSLALNSTINGVHGYLVNITSAAENAEIGKLFAQLPQTANSGGYWIGATRVPSNNAAWEWVDGPEAGQVFANTGFRSSTPVSDAYTNWYLPWLDNWAGSVPGGAPYGKIASPGTYDWSSPIGLQWDDAPNLCGGITGYIIEYSTADSAYKLNISDVLVADASSVASNSHVVSMLIADSSANVSSNLDNLEVINSKINSITLSDNSPINLSVSQLTRDADVIAKITNSSSITVSDSANHIAASIDRLAAMGNKLESIVINDHQALTITSRQLTADAAVLSKIVGGGLSAQDITNPLTQIYDAENGHIYQLIQTGTQVFDPSNLNNGYVSWSQARSLALNSTINGVHGYLANITSAAENSEVAKLFTQQSPTPLAVLYWIGASRITPNNPTWKWVDGPEAGQVFDNTGFGLVSLDNWAGNEPDGAPYGCIHPIWNTPISLLWDDAPNFSGGANGYIIEYSTTDSAYKLNITEVLAADAASVASNSHVLSMLIADSSANISNYLDGLEAINSKITSITLSDVTPVTVSVAQLTTDHDVIAKITNPSAITVSDTADHLSAAIDQLEAMGSQLSSVIINDQKSLTISSHQLTADAHALSKIVNVGSSTGNYSKTLTTELNLDSTVYSGYRDGLYVLGLNSITLAPGKYVVDYLQKGELGATYSGWGPWGDPGNNYYSSEYNIEINGNYVLRWSGNTFSYGLDNTIASGKSHPFTFTLTTETNVDFFISDNFYVDNGGGISIAVNKLTDNSYNLNITDVQAIDASLVSSNPHVVSMLIADSSANISTNLDSLETINSKITSITLSDNTPLTISIDQLNKDQNVISKITNNVGIVISDTAANISSQLDYLEQNHSTMSSIIVTDPINLLALSSSQLIEDHTVLQLITNGKLKIVDSSDHILSKLDLLESLIQAGQISGIHLTDLTVPNITLTAQQFIHDQDVLLQMAKGQDPNNPAFMLQLGSGETLTAAQAATINPILYKNFVANSVVVNDSAANVQLFATQLQDLTIDPPLGKIKLIDSANTNINLSITHLNLIDIIEPHTGYSVALNISDVGVDQAFFIASKVNVASIQVYDLMSNIVSNLASLQVLNAKISSIYVINNLSIELTEAQINAAPDIISKLTNYQFSVSPQVTSTYLLSHLAYFEGLAKAGLLNTITLTDIGTPVLSITKDQYVNDSNVFGLITTPHQFKVSGASTADVNHLISNHLSTQFGVISDTAQNIQANWTQLMTLNSAGYISSIVVNDGELLTVKEVSQQSYDLLSHVSTEGRINLGINADFYLNVNNASLYSQMIAKEAYSFEKVTLVIDHLFTNRSSGFEFDNLNALLETHPTWEVTPCYFDLWGDANLIDFANHITNKKLLDALGSKTIDFRGSYLTPTIEQFENYYQTPFYKHLQLEISGTITDTAANIQANLDALAPFANHLGVMPIVLSDDLPPQILPQIKVSAIQVVSDIEVLNHIKTSYLLSVRDTAANLSGLDLSHIKNHYIEFAPTTLGNIVENVRVTHLDLTHIAGLSPSVMIAEQSINGGAGTEIDITNDGQTYTITLTNTALADLQIYEPVDLSMGPQSPVISSTYLLSHLAYFENLAKAGILQSITLTDADVPILSITNDQYKADSDVFRLITTPYQFAISGVTVADWNSYESFMFHTKSNLNIAQVSICDTAANLNKSNLHVGTHGWWFGGGATAELTFTSLTVTDNGLLSIDSYFTHDLTSLTTSGPININLHINDRAMDSNIRYASGYLKSLAVPFTQVTLVIDHLVLDSGSHGAAFDKLNSLLDAHPLWEIAPFDWSVDDDTTLLDLANHITNSKLINALIQNRIESYCDDFTYNHLSPTIEQFEAYYRSPFHQLSQWQWEIFGTITDTAANIQANLDQLSPFASHLGGMPIELSDVLPPQINVSVSQLVNDVEVLNHIKTSYLLSVRDTAANLNRLDLSLIKNPYIEFAPTTLGNIAVSARVTNLDLTHLTGLSPGVMITAQAINGGPGTEVDITNEGDTYSIYLINTALADLQIYEPVDLSMGLQSPVISSSYLLSHLSYFEGLVKAGALTSIALTDSDVPLLKITAGQFVNNSTVFSLITSPYAIAIDDVAVADVSSLMTNNLITQIGVLDTAGNIEGSWYKLELLNATGKLTNIVVSDGNLLTVNEISQESYDLLALVNSNGPINLYFGSGNSDTSLFLQMIGNHIYDFNKVTLVTDELNQSYSPNDFTFDNISALLNAHPSWEIAKFPWFLFGSYNLIDLANQITNEKLINAIDLNGTVFFEDSAYLTPTVEAIKNYYQTPFYKHFQWEISGVIRDTATNIQANLDALTLSSHLNVMKIELSDAITPQINVIAAQVVSDVGVLNHIKTSFILSVHDTAANLNNLDLNAIQNPYIEFAPTTLGNILENKKVSALDLTHVAGLVSSATITEQVINGGLGTQVNIINGGDTYTISLINTKLADLQVYEPVDPNLGMQSTVSSSYLLSHLNYFESLVRSGLLTSITLTDSDIPMLSITEGQFKVYSNVFGLINSPHQFAISGVAASKVNSYLVNNNNFVTQVDVSDTASNIQANWNNWVFAKYGYNYYYSYPTNIVVTDGNLLTLENDSKESFDLLAHVSTSGPIQIRIDGWPYSIPMIANEAHSFAQITQLTLGITYFNQFYGDMGAGDFDNLNALLNAHPTWDITPFYWNYWVDAPNFIDLATHITNDKLLNALGAKGVYMYHDPAYLTPTLEQFENYYQTSFYKHFQWEISGAITDTAKNVQSNLDTLSTLTNHLSKMAIMLTDLLPPQINVSGAQVMNDVEVLNHINSSYLLSVNDVASNLNNLDLSHINNHYIELAPTTLGDIVENTKITDLNLTHVAGLIPSAIITEHSINAGLGTEVDITNGSQTYTISLLNTALADLVVYQPVNFGTAHDWDGRSGNEHYVFQNNQSGDISDSHFDRIFNWIGQDTIEYANNPLTATGNSGTELAGLAHIDLSTGNLVFSSQDNTLQKQISAAEAAIAYSNDPTSGHFAKWENGGNTYVLITDGHTSSGVGHGDNLVELVGVTSSHAQLVNGTITYG